MKLQNCVLATALLVALSSSAAAQVHPYECRKAKREMEFTGTSMGLTPEQRNERYRTEQEKVNRFCGTNDAPPVVPTLPQRQAAPPPYGNITRCEPGFCFDAIGRVYHRNGPNFLTAPDGRTCHRAGPNWICP